MAIGDATRRNMLREHALADRRKFRRLVSRNSANRRRAHAAKSHVGAGNVKRETVYSTVSRLTSYFSRLTAGYRLAVFTPGGGAMCIVRSTGALGLTPY